MRVRNWKYVLLVLVLVGISLTVGAQQEPTAIQPQIQPLAFPRVDDMVILAGNIYVAGHDSEDKAYLTKYNTNLRSEDQVSWKGRVSGMVADSGFIYIIDNGTPNTLKKFSPNLTSNAISIALDRVSFERVTQPSSGFKPYKYVMSPQGIDMDSNGDIYILYFVKGEFYTAGEMEPFEVIWLQKYTNNLTFIRGGGWVLRKETPTRTYSFDLGIDRSSNSIYVVGSIQDDKGNTLFLLSFNSALQSNWNGPKRLFGTPNPSVSLPSPRVAADAGRVYATAFGKLPGGKGLDIILEVRNGSGDLIGGSSWGWLSAGIDMSYDIAIDTTTSNKDVYVIGTRLLEGALIIKFARSGNPIWSRIWQGNNDGKAVVLDSGSVYVAGETANNGFILKTSKT